MRYTLIWSWVACLVLALFPCEARSSSIAVRARAALILDMQKGEVIYQKNATLPLPIASITKLMTAVTYLRLNPDLEKQISVNRADVYRANWTKLRYRERVLSRDLLYTSLVVSDNVAARVLARATGLSRAEFVIKMNETAREIGLANSRFTDPTGLDDGNTASAVDCVTLLWVALQHELLAEILMTKEYEFRTNRRLHQIRTTNIIMYDRVPQRAWECVGSKTGYIRAAGYCLVLRVSGDAGDDIFAVILGSNTSRSRFSDMRRMMDWSISSAGMSDGMSELSVRP